MSYSMTRAKRAALALLVVVLAGGMAGCLQDAGETPAPERTDTVAPRDAADGTRTAGTRTPGDAAPARSGAELQSAALSSMAAVDSYVAETTMRVRTSARRNATVVVDGTSRVDVAERRMKVNQSVRVVSGTDNVTRRSVAYVVDDTRYRRVDGAWRSVGSDDGTWNETHAIGAQRRLLEAANATRNGTATVDGEETVVLELSGGNETFASYFGDALADRDDGASFEVTAMTYRVYLDRETDRPRKIHLELTLEREGQSFEVWMTTHVRGYDDDVTVTLPPGVAE